MYNKMKKGIFLINILVSLIILSIGIITLLKVYPVISSLSERGKDNATISMISTQIFTLIDKVYSSSNNDLPSSVDGCFLEFPQYKYKIDFSEERKNLYNADIEISWKRKGKIEKRYFTYSFRRE